MKNVNILGIPVNYADSAFKCNWIETSCTCVIINYTLRSRVFIKKDNEILSLFTAYGIIYNVQTLINSFKNNCNFMLKDRYNFIENTKFAIQRKIIILNILNTLQ